ncbi:MAG TPA: tetratricopeptide repeat protein, partial [Chloroflexia bacterium]|nr:tetratricopeptide repeat protein [Chloroflexia bacterium]
HWLGQYHLNISHDYAKARKEFHQAGQLAKKEAIYPAAEADALKVLADEQQTSGPGEAKENYSLALGLYARAQELDPLGDYHPRIGSVYLAQHDYEKARNEFALATRPNKAAESWSSLGEAYNIERQYEQGIEAFKQATCREPHNWVYANSLGTAYANNRQFSGARPAFERASALEPTNPIPIAWLAIIDNEQGNPQACEELARAIELAEKPESGADIEMVDRWKQEQGYWGCR